MKASWWVIVLSAVLGGVVGGAVSRWFPSSGQANATVGPEKHRVIGEDSAEQAQDDEESETKAQLRRLEHRIALLTAAAQSRDGKALSDESEGETAGSGKADDPPDVADPVFEAAVLDIMDREQERKEQKQVTSSKEQHAERGRRYATELGETLKLTPQQQTEMAQVVASYFDEWRALRDGESPSHPATRNEWRAERERMNQAMEEKIKGVLGPQQYAAYEALDPDDKVGWGRGSRGSTPGSGQANPGAPKN